MNAPISKWPVSLGRRGLLVRVVLALAAVGLTDFAMGGSATRTSAFEYDTATGILKAEIVEPDQADFCVRTEYVLDAYGNRTSTSVKNCTGASGSASFTTRTTTASYTTHTVSVGGVSYAIPTGTFPRTITNAKGHTETREHDPRFGGAAALTGPNGLTTRWQYDDFGRKVLETGPDNNKIVYRHCVLSGQGDTTGNSSGCTTPSGAPAYAVSYVEAQPVDFGGSPSGPYTRQYSDALGRVIREEKQGFDGGGQPGSARTIVKDTEYNSFGGVAKVTQPYFLESGSSLSAAGSPAAGWSATQYDALGRPAAIYVRDDEGSGSYAGGSVTSAVFSYDGLSVTEARTRTSKNASGQQQLSTTLTSTRVSNPLGQVIEVRDANGGTLRKIYDPFGNVLETQDAMDNRVVMDFDIRGRKKTLKDPNAGLWTYGYDALGQLTSQRSPLQTSPTTMAYDTLGRMISRTEPEYSTTWTYDSCTKGVGKLCSTSTTNGQTKTYGYDFYGRAVTFTQAVANGPTFTLQRPIDSRGRVSQQYYPTGEAVTYTYTTLGYLAEIRRGGAAVWKLNSANAWGKPDSLEVGGTGAQITRYAYDPVTGRTAGISAGTNGAIMAQTYGWDTVGNLTDRSERYDAAGNILTENFGYDVLNRLASYETSSPNLAPTAIKTVSLTYNAIGNILTKSDVGTYIYNASGPASVRPNAVTQVIGGPSQVGTRNYKYDDAGNMKEATASKYSGLQYTSFNLPTILAGGAAATIVNYSWAYGADHERVKETRSDGRTTYYFHPDNAGGLAFEQERNGATITNRHYVGAMGRTFLVMESAGEVTSATGVSSFQYWHTDQLGSVVAITDQTGAVLRRYSYDPFGKRRQPEGTYDPTFTLVSAQGVTDTDRGFTGHEHLDDVGIVHMNGRTYDPLIGRFMQTDPFIQDGDLLQNYNRYSYVLNNPLNATDPSGHFSLGELTRASFKFNLNPSMRNAFHLNANMPGQEYVDRFVMRTPIAYQIGQMAAAFFTPFCGGCGGALWAAYYGEMATGSSGAALQAGALAWATTWAYGQVGANFPFDTQPFMNLAGHAMLGCAGGEISGAGCGRSAISAVAGKLGTVVSDGNPVAAIVAGGTASVVSGGKFANGAVTAAFGYLFNHLGHSGAQQVEEYREANGISRPLGAYLPGTQAGDSAAQYWADMQVSTGNSLYAIPGMLASLWTPDTAVGTAFTLGTAGGGGAFMQAAGPLKQWVRIGPSYSKVGQFQVDMSIRWGASPAGGGKYIRQIPSPTLQRFNQWLRGQQAPVGGWRAADPGHFHFWR